MKTHASIIEDYTSKKSQVVGLTKELTKRNWFKKKRWKDDTRKYGSETRYYEAVMMLTAVLSHAKTKRRKR